MNDPYYLAKHEIEQNINLLKDKFQMREDMIHDNRGANPLIFDNLRLEMQDLINKIFLSTEAIEDIIPQLEADPSKYSLSDNEILDRKNFLSEAKKITTEIEIKMNSQTLFNQNIISNHHPNDEQTALQLEERHHAQLDQIFEISKQNHQIALEIDHQLDDDSRILNEIDVRMDNTGESMKQVTQQIKNLIEEEGKTPTCLVLILSLVLILLLFFVI